MVGPASAPRPGQRRGVPSGLRNWFYKFFRPLSGADLRVVHTYWELDPTQMGPADFEKLWKELEPLFPIGRFPGVKLFQEMTAYTKSRRTQGRTFYEVESFVENEHLRGILDEVEVDFVLAVGDDPDDLRQVARALHLTLSYDTLPHLVLRGEEEWTNGTASKVLQFCKNRPSHSLAKRLSFAFATAVLAAFGFFALGAVLGLPAFTIFVEFPSLILGASIGLAAYVTSRSIFPVSRLYADSRTGEPSWWYTRAEVVFWGLVTGVVAVWIAGFLTGGL